MKTEEISKRIENIPDGLVGAAWGFAFLKCFQGTGSKLPASSFDRVKQGPANFAGDKVNEILWKKVIYFRWVKKDVRLALTEAKESAQVRNRANKPMFIIIASPDEIATHDLDQGEDLVIPRDELPSYAYFFLPFAGKKKITVTSEALEVDVKATRKMAVLFDEIRKTNPGFDSHDLNVLLARLLFCFYGEDTGIFSEDLFTNSVSSHTDADGSDLSGYLATVFRRFATDDVKSFAAEYRKFPYVNGGLFEGSHPVPVFTEKSRKQLLENGKMDWKAINPDIFGSMFQAIIDPEKRHELGMHYTSRENIMKVISPLFLDALREEFEKSKGNLKKLEALHKRISEIKIFDPACGSGNFLILAYEKLRELEMDIIEAKGEVAELFPRIKISQFYGIEIDDFAHELAMLALWIKEHQMNLIFHARFHSSPAALPLREGARIIRDNAARCDWNDICPRTATTDGKQRQLEIYVLGNPPYLGSSMQDAKQKAELAAIARTRGLESFKNLDYISCWFFKAADYLKGYSVTCAFVSTNSISQGEHTALLWQPVVDNTGVEIHFAYESFKWKNSAVGNAGVTCTVVGLRNTSKEPKWIIDEKQTSKVSFINAYLKNLDEVWILRQPKSVSKLPGLKLGSKPTDSGGLSFDHAVYHQLKDTDPVAIKYTKGYLGADEFLEKKLRYCLWIPDHEVEEARQSPFIQERLRQVAAFRSKPTNSEICQNFANRPHRFLQRAHENSDSIIFPSHTSEGREYIPLGFLDSNTVISNAGQAIYNAQAWTFGVLSSKMHLEWTKLIAGRLETRVRYSSFVYNNFPIPPLSKQTKEAIEEAVFEIIDIREEFHELTYADMYDPGKMPAKLLNSHRTLDRIVDACYRDKPFKDVNERLELLIALYKKTTKQN